MRLVQFRSFYVITLFYIYCTRILTFIMFETLPYTRAWAVSLTLALCSCPPPCR